MLFHLLKNKLLIVLFHFRNLNASFVKGKMIRYIILLLVPSWFYKSTYGLFSSWFIVPGFTFDMIFNFIFLAITGLFFLLTISGITLALHYNFMSTDLQFLLALPLKKSTLFKHKFFEILISNSALYILLGLPVIVAALIVFKVPVVSFLLVIILSLLFLAIPSGLASLISILFAVLLPVKRTKNITSFIMGMFLIAIWGGLQFFRMSRLDPYSGDFDKNLLNQLSGTSTFNSGPFLPSTWLVNIIKGFVDGNAALVLANIALIGAVSYILLQISTRLLCLIYNKEFSPIIKSAQKHPKTITEKKISSAPVNQFHVLTAIMIRDIKCLFRDSRFAIQLFFYAGLFVIFPFIIQNPIPNINETFVPYLPFINLAFVSSLMAGGLTSRLVPLEKFSFSYSKILPQPTRGYMFSKILTGFTLTLVASLIGLLINTVKAHIPFDLVLHILLLLILNILGATATGLYAGSLFANFSWENPRQMLNENGNLILSIAVMLIMIIGIIIFAVMLSISNPFLATLAYLLYTVVLFGVVFFLSGSKIDKIEWTY